MVVPVTLSPRETKSCRTIHFDDLTSRDARKISQNLLVVRTITMSKSASESTVCTVRIRVLPKTKKSGSRLLLPSLPSTRYTNIETLIPTSMLVKYIYFLIGVLGYEVEGMIVVFYFVV